MRRGPHISALFPLKDARGKRVGWLLQVYHDLYETELAGGLWKVQFRPGAATPGDSSCRVQLADVAQFHLDERLTDERQVRNQLSYMMGCYLIKHCLESALPELDRQLRRLVGRAVPVVLHLVINRKREQVP